MERILPGFCWDCYRIVMSVKGCSSDRHGKNHTRLINEDRTVPPLI